MSVLEAALTYLESGWSVLPLHGKKPATMLNGRAFSWARLQIERPYPSHIHHWHKNGLLQNVGIVTGAVSNNLVVIDLDGEAAVRVFYARWLPLTATYTVATGSGRGVHLYFQCQKLPPTTRVMGRHGNIEVRASGCYIAAPPSLHSDTGQLYVPVGGNTESIAALPDLEAVVNWLKGMSRPARPAPAADRPERTIGGAWARRALIYEARDVRAAPEGSRNTRLNVAAYNLGQIVADGLLSRGEVEAALLAAAIAAGLSEREARATIASGLEAGIAEPRSQQWTRRRR